MVGHVVVQIQERQQRAQEGSLPVCLDARPNTKPTVTVALDGRGSSTGVVGLASLRVGLGEFPLASLAIGRSPQPDAVRSSRERG